MSAIQQMMQMLQMGDQQMMGDIQTVSALNDLENQQQQRPFTQQLQQMQLQRSGLENQVLQRELAQPVVDPSTRSLVELVQSLGFTDPTMASSLARALIERQGINLPQPVAPTGGLPPEVIEQLRNAVQSQQTK